MCPNQAVFTHNPVKDPLLWFVQLPARQPLSPGNTENHYLNDVPGTALFTHLDLCGPVYVQQGG